MPIIGSHRHTPVPQRDMEIVPEAQVTHRLDLSLFDRFDRRAMGHQRGKRALMRVTVTRKGRLSISKPIRNLFAEELEAHAVAVYLNSLATILVIKPDPDGLTIQLPIKGGAHINSQQIADAIYARHRVDDSIKRLDYTAEWNADEKQLICRLEQKK